VAQKWNNRRLVIVSAATTYMWGTTQGGSQLLKLEYNFWDPNANASNGNLVWQRIKRMDNNAYKWTQNYAYDGVSRLSAMSESWSDSGVNQIGRAYGYDPYGNRMVISSYGLAYTDPKEPTGTNATFPNNRLTISGLTDYDSAGNQTAYGAFTLGYDAENRNITTSGSGGNGTFYYDGDGRRVKKVWTSGSTTTTTYYVYNALGQMAVENSSEAPSNIGTTYLLADMLGSVRAIADNSGSVSECYDYLPFGRMLSNADNNRNGIGCYPQNPDTQLSSSAPQKFTGKERDAKTGLDYFGARYLSSAQGRWTSPDPTLLSVNAFNPQSWNRYSYVLNNSLLLLDPNGLWELEWRSMLDKKTGKHITQMFAIREEGDDGASLANQLHLKGKDAKNLIKSIDGGNATEVILDQIDGVDKAFQRVEEKYSKGLDGEQMGDCSKNAAEIFKGVDFIEMGTNVLDNKIGGEWNLHSYSWKNANIGDIVRYADKGNIAKHFANIIFFDKEGTPIVFSKSGKDNGPYEWGSAYSFQGVRGPEVDYGTIRGLDGHDYGVYH
jgi:RHS repeat-associated protein